MKDLILVSLPPLFLTAILTAAIFWMIDSMREVCGEIGEGNRQQATGNRTEGSVEFAVCKLFMEPFNVEPWNRGN